MQAKWIIFDAMGVVFVEGDDNNELLVPYIQKRNPDFTRERINELYYKATVGGISSKEFWSELGFGDEYPRVERNYLDTCLRIDPEFVTVADKLAADHNLALISNDVGEWSAYLRERFDLNRLFKVTVISGDVGCRKPDERVFNILLDRTGASPRECVFIDDALRNLRAASQIGMRTIRFFRKKLAGDIPASEFTPDAEIRSFNDLPTIDL